MSNTLTLDNDERVQYEQLSRQASLNWPAVELLHLGKMASLPNYTYDATPTPGSSSKNQGWACAVLNPPCPSNVPVRHRRPCIYRPTIGENRSNRKHSDRFLQGTPGLFGVADYVPALMEYAVTLQRSIEFPE